MLPRINRTHRLTLASNNATFRRSHFKAVSGTAITNVAASLIGSVGGLILARTLGPAHRGDLVTILQWPAMIGSVASLGITQATCYWIANSPEVARRIKSTAAWASITTGVIIALLGPMVAFMIGRNTQVALLLTAVFGVTPLYIVGGVWISALQAKSIANWNLARTVQPLLYLLTIFILWATHLVTLETVVIAYIGSIFVQTIYAMLIVRKHIGRYTSPATSTLIELYRYGVKVFAGTIPRLVNFSLDQLLLSIWPGISPAELGNYVVAVSLSSLVLPLSQAFGSIAFPQVAAAKSESDIRKIERWSIIGSALSAVVVITIVAILAPILVVSLFGSGYTHAIVVLWILAPGVVFLSVGRTLSDILQGRGRPINTSAAEGIGALVTITLLLLFIPRYGIKGAAFTSTVTYATVTIFLYWRFNRVRKLSLVGTDDL